MHGLGPWTLRREVKHDRSRRRVRVLSCDRPPVTTQVGNEATWVAACNPVPNAVYGGSARTHCRHHSRCSPSPTGHVQSFPWRVPQQDTRLSAHDLATTAVAVLCSTSISCAKVWARAWRARRYLPPVQARSPACTARPPNRGRVLLACLGIKYGTQNVGSRRRPDAARRSTWCRDPPSHA